MDAHLKRISLEANWSRFFMFYQTNTNWVAKVRTELVFKLGVSSFLVVEICFLGLMLFWAYAEYDGTFVETAGFTMVTIAVAFGLAALMWSLFQVFKWKPS